MLCNLKLESIDKRIRLKINYSIYSLIQQINRKRLKKFPFVIVSNNCWGAEVYRYFDKEYNTPFIGLFLYAPCYIKMLKDFDNYMQTDDMKFIKNSKYFKNNAPFPIGLLKNEIEIHFVHYKNEDEAIEKWNRRKKRMPKNFDSYYFKFCDRDNCTEALLDEFHNFPFKNKVSFST